MAPILWVAIALVAAAGVFYVVIRRAQRRLPPIVLPPGEKMPKTALQRLAEMSFIAAASLSLAAAALVVFFGVDVAWNRDVIRLSATGLALGALAVFAFYWSRVAIWIEREDGALDERDRAILATAPTGQAPAILMTLAAWLIGLNESYHAAAAIPSVFLYLIFWSCIIVTVLSLLAGVVVGYRRS